MATETRGLVEEDTRKEPPKTVQQGYTISEQDGQDAAGSGISF